MRLRRRTVLAGLLGAALTACAGPKTPGQPAAGPEDTAPPIIGVIGAKAQHAPPFLGVPQTNFYCLRSFIDRRTEETQHQLYVADSYSGAERGWNGAHDGAGHPLRFIEVSRNEIACDGGCAYAEEFAAVIPERELRASPRGLTVVFTSSSGAEKRIAVSGAQISAQLAAVTARRSPVQPAAARSEPAPPRLSAPHQ